MALFISSRDKLGEAKFYLGKLQEECDSSKPKDPKHFSYYLSAFLNATYATIERAKKAAVPALRATPQCSFSRQKRAWESNLGADDKKIWEFINDSRGQDTHTARVETVQKTKAVPIRPSNRSQIFLPVHFTGDDPAAKMKQELGLPAWATSWFIVYEHYFPLNNNLSEVLTTCRKYHVILAGFVAALEQTLGATGYAAGGKP